MKSGTSTLHYILNQHPHVYIPDNEVHFFDIDNIFQHPDFNYFDGSNWLTQKIEDKPMQFWKWYSSHFDDAEENQIIGEDSTTYITSEKAAKRIQLQNKAIKLIILLRNPTARAYSQYWHMVGTGRAMYNFEDTIRYNPYSILYRSLYLDQLNGILKHVSQDLVEIIVFEEFLANKCNILRKICAHIGVDYELLPKDSIDSHINQTQLPKYPAIQLLKNRFFREIGNQHYASFLPVKPRSTNTKKVSLLKLVNLTNRILNPLIRVKPPKIRDSTKQFLDNYFKSELKGINEILGKDVLSMWFD